MLAKLYTRTNSTARHSVRQERVQFSRRRSLRMPTVVKLVSNACVCSTKPYDPMKIMDQGTQAKVKGKRNQPHKHPCNLMPVNVPTPALAQSVLHPRKDVFILKVAKVGAQGDRRSKLELELVTPKGPDRKVVARVDTRDTQCDQEPPPCNCSTKHKKKK